MATGRPARSVTNTRRRDPAPGPNAHPDLPLVPRPESERRANPTRHSARTPTSRNGTTHLRYPPTPAADPRSGPDAAGAGAVAPRGGPRPIAAHAGSNPARDGSRSGQARQCSGGSRRIRRERAGAARRRLGGRCRRSRAADPGAVEHPVAATDRRAMRAESAGGPGMAGRFHGPSPRSGSGARGAHANATPTRPTENRAPGEDDGRRSIRPAHVADLGPSRAHRARDGPAE